jgi:hypothetical protein
VLKAIEEAKLRSKTDEDIQVRHVGSRAVDACSYWRGAGLACVHSFGMRANDSLEHIHGVACTQQSVGCWLCRKLP